MNTIRTLRPFLVWAALGSVGLTSLLSLITFIGLIVSSTLPSAASLTVSSLMSPFAALVVLGAVLLAVLLPPKLEQARLFAIIGLAIVGAFTALGVLFSLIALGTLSTVGPLSVLTALVRHLANLAVPAVVALILFKLLSELPAATPAPAIGYGQSVPAQGYGQPSDTQVTEPSFGQQPPAQQPGAGAMWGSANQAASGASAATWQGNQAGWGDQAQQQPAQQPSAPQFQPSASQQPGQFQQPAPQPAQFQQSASQQPGQFQQPAPQQGQFQPQQHQPQAPQQDQQQPGWYPVDQPPQQPGS